MEHLGAGAVHANRSGDVSTYQISNNSGAAATSNQAVRAGRCGLASRVMIYEAVIMNGLVEKALTIKLSYTSGWRQLPIYVFGLLMIEFVRNLCSLNGSRRFSI